MPFRHFLTPVLISLSVPAIAVAKEFPTRQQVNCWRRPGGKQCAYSGAGPPEQTDFAGQR